MAASSKDEESRVPTAKELRAVYNILMKEGKKREINDAFLRGVLTGPYEHVTIEHLRAHYPKALSEHTEAVRSFVRNNPHDDIAKKAQARRKLKDLKKEYVKYSNNHNALERVRRVLDIEKPAQDPLHLAFVQLNDHHKQLAFKADAGDLKLGDMRRAFPITTSKLRSFFLRKPESRRKLRRA